MPRRPLCACSRTKTPPHCDGSHSTAGWACAKSPRVRDGFLATARYQNLALRLAAEHEGASLLPGEPWPEVEHLSVIADLGDLHELGEVLRTAPTSASRLFLVGGPSEAGAAWAQRVYEVSGHDLSQAAEEISAGLRGPAIPTTSRPLLSAFLSHAVADEPLILPALERLRIHSEADFFLCADSIPQGSDWHQEIERALRERDCFVGLVSAASAASHFCSYEVGVASGLGKPVRFYSLDGTRPQAFAARYQCVDLPRLQATTPWLEPIEVLVRELARGLTTPEESSP